MKFLRRDNIYFIFIVLLLCTPFFALGGILFQRIVITPNDLFFTVSIGPTPKIEESTWTMPVNGYVDYNLTFNYTNFTTLSSIEILATLQCVEGPSGTALWKGVLVKDLLAMVHPKTGAVDVVFHAADGYSSSLTVAEINLDNIILAYEMNGVSLPAEQGFPLRVVAPNHAGYKWVKWIVHIEIVDYDYKGYWEDRGWSDDARNSPINDWIIHAFLFSFSFVLGGIAIVSGLKLSPKYPYFKNFPKFITKKFHLGISLSYSVLSIISYFYWIVITLFLRGNLFYTVHGYFAIITIALLIPGLISGLRVLKKYDEGRRKVHLYINAISFLCILFTIIIGFTLPFSNNFRIF
ncbi:MAG: DUF4079 family protein [Candidatus Lokiarchaeota archaeon]|nr:DUF4079 family protein [Candidatus Lokiarchaeota archaeon]